MFNETPKSRSHVSKMGFVVVPSVSDGVLNPPSPREGTTPEQMSKMGFGVVPSVSDGVLNPPSQREGTTPEQMSKMIPQARDYQLTTILTRCRKGCLKIIKQYAQTVSKNSGCWTISDIFVL